MPVPFGNSLKELAMVQETPWLMKLLCHMLASSVNIERILLLPALWTTDPRISQFLEHSLPDHISSFVLSVVVYRFVEYYSVLFVVFWSAIFMIMYLNHIECNIMLQYCMKTSFCSDLSYPCFVDPSMLDFMLGGIPLKPWQYFI